VRAKRQAVFAVLSYHVITLSAIGEADTPAGGSVCMRLKSRIRRLLAAVDMLGGDVWVAKVSGGWWVFASGWKRRRWSVANGCWWEF
jgi:hypothetical protein